MTLKARFTLIGVGLAVFLLITPFLVLFARGFKIDWEKRQIVKTGTIVVKTLPENASVYLNDELERKNTPYTGRFILPGTYDVRVEKEGYQSWTKRLSIIPQLVTWANLDREQITLFLNQPKLVTSVKTNDVSVSKNYEQLGFTKDGQVYFLNTSDGDTHQAGAMAATIAPLNLNPKLSWTNGSSVYDRFKDTNLTALPLAQIDKIEKLESNGDYTAFQIAGQLYLVEPKNTLVLLDTQVSNFTLDGEDIWYLQGNTFKSQNLRSRNQTYISRDLPAYTTSQIIRGDGRVFLILDSSLYTINDNLERIYEGITSGYWDTASNKLVFWNNNEILVFDSPHKRTELVVRTISPIKDPQINWTTGYLLFANEGKVKAIELDGRDHRNIYTIAELDTSKGDNFTVSQDGKLLYIYNPSEIRTYRIK